MRPARQAQEAYRSDCYDRLLIHPLDPLINKRGEMRHRLTFLFVLMTCFAWRMTAHAQNQRLRPEFRPIVDNAELPRVLLLGDSISIGYTLGVREQMRGHANVHRAAENCGPTTRGLKQLDKWLGEKQWDVIHFNFGLHDLKYMNKDGNLTKTETGRVQVPPAEYERNLRALIRRLKETGAQLIWCSTTPVPQGALGRVVGDAKKYNTIAIQVVQDELGEDCAINDLYQFCLPRLPDIQRPANVHFTPAGSNALATQVTKKIRKRLKKPD